MDRALWFRCRVFVVASEPYSRRGCGFNSRRRFDAIEAILPFDHADD
jgi:hypothetical protein